MRDLLGTERYTLHLGVAREQETLCTSAPSACIRVHRRL